MRLPIVVILATLTAACDVLPGTTRDTARTADTTGMRGATSPDTLSADSATGAIGDGRRIIAGGMLEHSGYATLDSVAFDVDRDGHRELITLAATVERNTAGDPLWEDGHHWALVARHASTQYVLIEEFVPWGAMRFWVTRPETGGVTRVIVLTESATGELGAVNVREFRFDDAARVYVAVDSIAAAGPMAQSTLLPR
jgi:hypothetical protein